MKNIEHTTKSRLYRIWTTMRSRCDNPNTPNYKNYGGRGIKICDEWNDYENFHAWAQSSGYADDLSIDRIDTNGDYCPENCQWATMKEQQNNRRNNKLITFNGKTQTMAQWAEEYNISNPLLFYRLNHGWTIEEALTKPVRPKKKNPLL